MPPSHSHRQICRAGRLPAVLTAAALAAFAVAGCGTTTQVGAETARTALVRFGDAFAAGRYSTACAYVSEAPPTGEPQSCAAALAVARRAAQPGQLSALSRQARTVAIAVNPNDLSARVGALPPTPIGLGGLSRDRGRWVIGVTLPQAGADGAAPSASAARRWVANWCSIKLGMRAPRIRSMMGTPTSTFAGDVAQLQWSYREFGFTAFLDATTRKATHLQADVADLTPAERARLRCNPSRSR